MVMHLCVLIDPMQVCLCVRAWGKRPARVRCLDVYHHVQSYVYICAHMHMYACISRVHVCVRMCV